MFLEDDDESRKKRLWMQPSSWHEERFVILKDFSRAYKSGNFISHSGSSQSKMNVHSTRNGI